MEKEEWRDELCGRLAKPFSSSFFTLLLLFVSLKERLEEGKIVLKSLGLLLHGWPDERARPEGGTRGRSSFDIEKNKKNKKKISVTLGGGSRVAEPCQIIMTQRMKAINPFKIGVASNFGYFYFFFRFLSKDISERKKENKSNWERERI